MHNRPRSAESMLIDLIASDEVLKGGERSRFCSSIARPVLSRLVWCVIQVVQERDRAD